MATIRVRGKCGTQMRRAYWWMREYLRAGLPITDSLIDTHYLGAGGCLTDGGIIYHGLECNSAAYEALAEDLHYCVARNEPF